MFKSVFQYYEEVCVKYPDQLACVCNDVRLSYKELDQKVSKLSQYLYAKSIGPEDVVGLMFLRSIDAIVAVLAVMKVGAAFMMIDPKYPLERIQKMLRASQSRLVLTNDNEVQGFPFSELQDFTLNSYRVEKTKKRAQLNFDTLPIPDRTLISFDKYSQYCKMSLSRKVVTIQATRGCPYKCIYCHNLWPKTHSRRSSDNIFNEIMICYKSGIRKFSILDDIFNLDIKESLRLFQLIIDHKLGIQLYFPNGLRGDILTTDYIDKMVEAGLVHLALSLETASERLQILIGKNLKLSKFRENIEYIASKYPHVMLDLFTMHGFPTETEEEAMQTLEFIESIKWIHFPYVFVLKIFPNSPVYEFAIKHGVSKEAIDRSIKYAYHEVSDTLPFPKEFSKMYQARVFNEYILNKERLLKVIPYQMSLLTEAEFLNQYDIYFPQGIGSRDELFKILNISKEELAEFSYYPDDAGVAEEFTQKIKKFFPTHQSSTGSFKILLLDVSQLFTSDSLRHNNLNEVPLGLMYLLTYLNESLGDQVAGRIIKPVIDYNNFEELRSIIAAYQPDLIGIRSLSVYKDFFHQTVSYIRSWGISCPIVTGGPYATSSYETLLQDRNVDLAVLGEGESTFHELISEMLANNNEFPSQEALSKIEGLAYLVSNPDEKTDQAKSIIPLDIINYSDALGCVGPVFGKKDKNLVYVAFTSGTSGEPKGIMIEQEGLQNLLENWIRIYRLDECETRILQLAAFTFDVFLGDMLKVLMTGGTLFIASDAQRRDPEQLVKLIEAESINIFESTPSYAQLLVDELYRVEYDFNQLDLIIIGGEASSLDQYRDLLHKTHGKVRIINGYGVSEASIESCYYETDHIDFFSQGQCPIGKAFQGVNLYVLNEKLEDQEEGELYIGGPSILRSYLNPKDNEAIINHSLKKERLYKTGDLVKKLADGNLLYMGRKDFQIKIRGHRIEPMEIESNLLAYSGITDCIVIEWENKLLAYYCSKDPVGDATIIQHLKLVLPDFMIPSFFLHIESIPLSPNGKVDRRSLPLPSDDDCEPSALSETVSESKLKVLWEKILKIGAFSIYDSFFDLGGDSLDSVRIITEINAWGGYQLKITDVYNYRTIHELGKFMDGISRHDIDKQSNAMLKSVYDSVEAKLTESELGNVPMLLNKLRQEEIEYSNQILSSTIRSEYANSSYKGNFREIFREVYFLEQIIFDDIVDLEKISEIVRAVYDDQRLLCSIIIKQKTQYYIREYAVPKNIKIPFLDLSGFSTAFNYSFITEVLSQYYQKSDKLRVLPFRILLIKSALKQYILGFLMDESIHDKIGVDIFKQSVIAKLQNRPNARTMHYQDFVNVVNRGPIALSADEMIDALDFQKFKNVSSQIKTQLYANRVKAPSMFLKRFKLDRFTKNQNQWEMALALFVLFCQKILRLEDIAMVVVHDARAFDKYAYANTIGEFMDFVPVVVNPVRMNQSEIAGRVNQNIKLAVDYKVNFINMYNNLAYSKKYQKMQKLAVSSVGPIHKSDSLLVFHYRSELDSSIELSNNNDNERVLNPWLKGVYFGVAFQDNELVINLNLPVQIAKQDLEKFFREEIEKESKKTPPKKGNIL